MKLLELKTQSFAGLGDQHLEFGDGLHLIFGPNEAGKSTLMSAIEIALFAPVDYERRTSKNYYWIEKALPLAGGDHYSLSLKGSDNQTELMLKKVFYCHQERAGNSIRLEYGDESYETTGIAQEKLREILGYGRSTYLSTVLINQGTLGETIGLLKGKEDDSIEQTLRSAVFESEGVSLDMFGRKLDARIKDKTGSWDIERNKPTSNSRPKRNVGAIATAYWDMQEFKDEADRAKSLESDLESTRENISGKKTRIDENTKELQELRNLEKSWRRYRDFQQVDADYKSVSEVVKCWGEHERVAENYDKEVGKLEKQREENKKKHEQVKTARRYHKIAKLFSQLKEKQEEASGIEKELDKLPAVEKRDLKSLDKLAGEVKNKKAHIEAQRLVASVTSEPGYEVIARKGIEGEEERIEGNRDLEASGKVSFEVPEVVQIEVRSGNEDIEKLQGEMVSAEEKLSGQLKELGVGSLEEAGSVFKKRESFQGSIGDLKQRIEVQLESNGFENLKSLEDEVEAIKESENPFLTQPEGTLPSEEEIQEEINESMQDLSDYKSEAQGKKEKFQEWKEKYGDVDTAMEEASELHLRRKELEKQVPEDFDPEEDEFDNLDQLHDKIEAFEGQNQKLGEEVFELRTDVRDMENQLEERPLEKITREAEEAERIYKTETERARALCEVRETYRQVRAEMDESTFDGLGNKYVSYLSTLTEGRYGDREKMKGLAPAGFIKTDISKEIPFDALSAGTKDGVAFALRLAIASEAFTEGNDFIIMDEPLINFDSRRKSLAAELIREISSRFQVIVFSCDRESRENLEDFAEVVELDERI